MSCLLISTFEVKLENEERKGWRSRNCSHSAYPARYMSLSISFLHSQSKHLQNPLHGISRSVEQMPWWIHKLLLKKYRFSSLSFSFLDHEMFLSYRGRTSSLSGLPVIATLHYSVVGRALSSAHFSFFFFQFLQSLSGRFQFFQAHHNTDIILFLAIVTVRFA